MKRVSRVFIEFFKQWSKKFASQASHYDRNEDRMVYFSSKPGVGILLLFPVEVSSLYHHNWKISLDSENEDG